VSLILGVRTLAVWHQVKRFATGLAVLGMPEIDPWLNTLRVPHNACNPKRNTCVVLSTARRPLLIAVLVYSACPHARIIGDKVMCTHRSCAAIGA
jgi:hypothetical protein